MVADKEILLLGVEILHATIRKGRRGTGNHLLVHAAHHLQLKVADRFEREHHLLDILRVMTRIDVCAEQTKEVAVNDTMHGSGNLTVVIGTDVIKL